MYRVAHIRSDNIFGYFEGDLCSSYNFFLLSANKAGSQHSKMGQHNSVSQKSWPPARFLHQDSNIKNATPKFEY